MLTAASPLLQLLLLLLLLLLLKKKAKEQYLYSAIYYASIVSKRADMDHTVLPANNTMPDFSL